MITNYMTSNALVSTNLQTAQQTAPATELNTDQVAEMVLNVQSLYSSPLPPEIATTMLATSPHLAIRRNYQFEPSKERLLELGFSSEVAEVQPLLLASILGGKQWVLELPFSGVDPNLTPLSLLPAGLPPCIDWHLGFQDLFEINRPLVLTDRVSVADLFSTRGYAAMTLLGAERWHGKRGNGPDLPDGVKRVRGYDVYFTFSCDIPNTPYLRRVAESLYEQLELERDCNLYVMGVPLKPDGTRLDYNEFFLRGGTVDQLERGAVAIDSVLQLDHLQTSWD